MFNNKNRTIKIEIDGGMSEEEMKEAFKNDENSERWSIELKVLSLYPKPIIYLDRRLPEFLLYEED